MARWTQTKLFYYRRVTAEARALILSVVGMRDVDGEPGREITDASIANLGQFRPAPHAALEKACLGQVQTVRILEILVGILVMLEHVRRETKLFESLFGSFLA